MRRLIVALLVLPVIAFAQDTITKADIPVAAKFFDLQFTKKEIDSMYEGVKGNINNIKRMHALPLDNSVPRSLAHSVVLPGMTFNTKQGPINWNIPANVQLPANKNDLAFYSLLQLASLV